MIGGSGSDPLWVSDAEWAALVAQMTLFPPMLGADVANVARVTNFLPDGRDYYPQRFAEGPVSEKFIDGYGK